jgi:hypothetical protein
VLQIVIILDGRRALSLLHCPLSIVYFINILTRVILSLIKLITCLLYCTSWKEWALKWKKSEVKFSLPYFVLFYNFHFLVFCSFIPSTYAVEFYGTAFNLSKNSCFELVLNGVFLVYSAQRMNRSNRDWFAQFSGNLFMFCIEAHTGNIEISFSGVQANARLPQWTP